MADGQIIGHTLLLNKRLTRALHQLSGMLEEVVLDLPFADFRVGGTDHLVAVGLGADPGAVWAGGCGRRN